MGVELRVEGLEQFSDLQRRLHVAGQHGLQRRMHKELRLAAGPVERDIRTAVMGLRVKSSRGGTAHPDRSSGLRARTARAVTTAVTRKGIRIKVSARRFGAYGTTLPRRMDPDASRRPWRSPVFGNRQVWKEQTGSPYFFVTVRRHRQTFRRAVGKAIDDTIRDLER